MRINYNYSPVKYFDKKYNIYYPENTNEAVIKSVKNNRIWEKKLVDRYSNLIKKNDIILDVGAYIGTHTIPFSILTGNNGMVYAFEPQNEIFNLLKKTINNNNISNINPINKAVYNKNTKINFSMNNKGTASITHIRNKLKDKQIVSMDAITIDSLNLDKVDLMKIDTEMCEWVILEGAEKTIQKCNPIIFLETFKTSNNIEKLKDFCRDHNYKYKHIGGDDYLLESKKFPKSKKAKKSKKVKKSKKAKKVKKSKESRN